MKPTTAQLNALLATRQFYCVDLWQLVLVDGTVLRYCSGDADITASAQVYSAGGSTGALWKVDGDESDAVWEIGTQASQLQVSVIPRGATLYGMAFNVACRFGVLDGATLAWSLAVMPTYGNTTAGGVVPMFNGRIVEVVPLDQIIQIAVNSPMELLDQQLPRNVFQAPCMNTLYDSACTLNQASFATAVTILAGSTTTSLILSGAASRATGYFDQGKIAITTGPNAGFTVAVRSWTNGTATALVYPPLPVAPVVGNAATIYAGCDKLAATCLSKFSNKANFRAFPTIPQPESLVGIGFGILVAINQLGSLIA